ncbi:MAG: hypothetical protein M5U25_10990 [Planctomycetota bacterium]|nr:hypothetical protein [Planctomycetota bacterium]
MPRSLKRSTSRAPMASLCRAMSASGANWMRHLNCVNTELRNAAEPWK